jgi:hypothetical protein
VVGGFPHKKLYYALRELFVEQKLGRNKRFKCEIYDLQIDYFLILGLDLYYDRNVL